MIEPTCPACHKTGVEGEFCPTCPGFWYSTDPLDFDNEQLKSEEDTETNLTS